MVSRDDAFVMTREDVLRELELLPVWKLRAPVAEKPVTESIPPTPVAVVESKPIEGVVAASAIFIVSTDKKWAFVLPAVLSGQSIDLFNNILRALKIKPMQTIHTQQLTQDIAASGTSVVVAMGEIAAQQLLTSTQSIENLRGKIHLVDSVQVIATYHPDDLLQHLPNKAKTWDDLCMALSVVSA
ncbi:uracil-DNA glycosylase family protein [Methylotenera versatilis]|uniref:uracil-DNA glycosylase family protein n=1 Tax=Methylotenera versatilis TaxID=1055487 RepID=UPI0006474198|nr:uracil-DNA glycosylase family protein [Methylotenera versatilis]